MGWLQRLRLYIVNAFIAAIIAVVAIDTLPQSPPGVKNLVTPWLVRLGIRQDVWTLFAPEPDHVNTLLRAEITYRDGERREWHGPEWSKIGAWEKWIKHRHVEWCDHVALQNNSAAWEPWCRYLARAQRPELSNAERGAEVRVIYQEAVTAPADQRPWRSMWNPVPFDEGWVLTIEKFEGEE
jgi:hypothetical protein